MDTGDLKNIKVFDVADGVKLGKGKDFTKMSGGIKVHPMTDGWQVRMERSEKMFSVVSSGVGNPPKIAAGGSDGVRCDIDGNVWASAGWVGDGFDGVHVFNPEGQRIGFIKLPETASNLCFGGPKRNRLFITASQSLFSLYVNTRGAHFC